MPNESGVLEQNAPNTGFVMEGRPLYSRHSKPMDVVLKLLINGAASLCAVVLIGILGYILVNGLGYVSWQFLSTPYSKTKANLKGILPMITSTLYIVVITLLIAAPIGIYSVIYLMQYTKQDELVKAIHSTTGILSGIPSILFELFRRTVFCILSRLQISILVGCLTMTLCILPTIVRTTEESLISAPPSYEEGVSTLGTGKLRVILGIMLPRVIPGVLTTVIPAMGQIVGRSAALLFTSDLTYRIPKDFFQQIFSGGRTLILHLYRTAREVTAPDAMNITFATASVLLIPVSLLDHLVELLLEALQKGTE